MNVYQPAEDSHLLAGEVKKYAFGKVLDMGTGSGVLAESALKSSRVTSVTAADINKACRKNLSKRIRFIHSDLFSSIAKQKFDTIIFNPPYLPQDRGISDIAIYGGKKGYEVIERFLGSCGSHLSDKGAILLLFSSLTKKGKVDEIIEGNCFEKEELLSEQMPFFETLYVYMIKKSPLLVLLEKKGVNCVKKFAEGNRGIIFTGALKGKKVAVKAKKADSAAKGTIANEAKWLRLLNKRGIGPKLIHGSKDFLIYEFVEGDFIIDYLKSCRREKAVAAIKSVLEQCRVLDELKVNKEEMLRPQRHVIIRNGEPVMIDFERCNKSEKPKNVTQFCQFMIGGFTTELMGKRGIRIDKEKLISAAKVYKNKQSSKNFSRIKDELR